MMRNTLPPLASNDLLDSAGMSALAIRTLIIPASELFPIIYF